MGSSDGGNNEIAYWNSGSDPGVRNADWMKPLPDNTSVAALSIPGTHNTMVHYGGSLVESQSLALLVQLLIGIRFIDIRCRHLRNTLPIHHGAYFQQAHFEDVVREVLGFLDKHPSETVIMRLSHDRWEPDGNTQSFSTTVNGYLNKFGRHRFWLGTRVPTLGESRGKIILMNNYDRRICQPGIRWADIDLDDTYEPDSVNNKWQKVTDHLWKARQALANNKLFLTFSSYAGLPATPSNLAKNMNPDLNEYLKSPRSGKLGIIASNYPGADLVSNIIKWNF